MTEAQAAEAITAAFLAGWVALHPADPAHANHVPVHFEGETASSADRWIRMSILPTIRVQATMGPVGSRRFADRGVIMVNVWSDAFAGTKPILGLCDDVRSVLEAVSIAGIHTYAGTSRPVPTDGRWLQRTVTVPYRFDETR